VTALTAADLATIVAENPLLRVAADPSRLLVTVLADAAARAKVVRLVRQDWEPDALAVGTHAAYLWCASGVLDSKVAQVVGKTLGDGATSRNWATILKLDTMARSETA
jgi:uncharacterized protein (DUF1697 family)